MPCYAFTVIQLPFSPAPRPPCHVTPAPAAHSPLAGPHSIPLAGGHFNFPFSIVLLGRAGWPNDERAGSTFLGSGIGCPVFSIVGRGRAGVILCQAAVYFPPCDMQGGVVEMKELCAAAVLCTYRPKKD